MSAQYDWGSHKRVRFGWSSEVWPQLSPTESKKPIHWEFDSCGTERNSKPPVDLEFEFQKEAYKTIPPLILAPFHGLFVASRDGEIVDSDSNLASLTRRFFAKHGHVPVYITKVGERIRVTLSTPSAR